MYMHHTYEDTTTKTEYPPHYHETMIYHTTARNVGLYTSLSLAALGAARALLERGRNVTAASLAACAVLFLGLAMELNQTLLWPTDRAADAPTSKRVPIALAIAHILMCMALVVAIWRGIAKR
jgi:hypothetical protein